MKAAMVCIPGVDEKFRHLAHPAEVPHPVFLAESEILVQPCRTLSPSRTSVLTFCRKSLCSGSVAVVDFPEAESPVIQISADLWLLLPHLSFFVILALWAYPEGIMTHKHLFFCIIVCFSESGFQEEMCI